MNIQTKELMRYGINGFLATLIHYAVLTINLNIFLMSSAGMANLIASIFGITFSFIGNRYFVFNEADGSLLKQVIRFSSLYGTIAILHGLVLLLWTDWFRFDYRIGFLIATALQVSLSYVGNKKMVFNL
jgi:putative flippase GtrA